MPLCSLTICQRVMTPSLFVPLRAYSRHDEKSLPGFLPPPCLGMMLLFLAGPQLLLQMYFFLIF